MTLLGGQYRLVEKIGQGGMGEVYKAEDTRLHRTVAIKILPEAFRKDEERRRRFVTEAQAASALDHPAIVKVHDLVDTGDQLFIVMQYVEGKTLRELIDFGPTPLATVLGYATQIADALVRAHGAGVIHRDLKPENLMVTTSGQIKILDFGLAKLIEPELASSDESPTRDKKQTREGSILGTANYMSPEQAQGKSVDPRSDIFSLGSVLYELISSRRAFQADTFLATIAAISRDEPTPLRDHMPDIPIEVEAALARAMRKRPEERFASMEELRDDLSELEAKHRAGKLTPANNEGSPPRTIAIASLTAALALAALVSIFGPWESSSCFHEVRATPLAGLPGAKRDPALSPDGNQIAFLWNEESEENGHFDLYIMLTSSGQPLRLTREPFHHFSPTWSPDGSRIAFLRRTEGSRDGYGLFTVPALGGAPRRLTTTHSNRAGLSYAPGGEHLAFVDEVASSGAGAIFRFSTDTGERVQLTEPGEATDSEPVYSPDGQRVAFVRSSDSGGGADLYVVEAEGGDAARVTFDEAALDGVTWTPDGRHLVFASNREGADSWKLWCVPASGGEPKWVRGSGTKAHSPSFSAADGTLFYLDRSNEDGTLTLATPTSE